ncbi:ABC transporter substrate-binding protein [Paenibacillus cremeus]|nr:extracellular solute-binding protein [Paenibacillus cremeus]
MKRTKLTVIASTLAAMALLTACAGKTEVAPAAAPAASPAAAPAAQEDTKPVTIKIYQWGAFSDEQWQQLFVEPVKKKYPYITLEQVVRGKGTNPDELVASGQFPDIYSVTNDAQNQFVTLGLTQDQSALIKKQNIDLAKFDPAQLERSKVGDQLISLPFNMVYSVMFYNKDIFDKFGVPYPKDGMYWDEVINLAKQVTKSDAGFQYKGMHPQSLFAMKAGLPIDLLDNKTDASTVNTDAWKNIVTQYKDLLTIPGNDPKGTAFADVVNAFIKDKNTAMVISNVMSSMPDATKNGFNWDMAQAPSHRGLDGVNGGGQTLVFGVTKTSKNQEAAMKVISVLTSDEVQGIAAKKFGYFPALNSKEIRDAFGADMPFLKGKNVQSIFKGKPAPYMVSSPFSGNADVRKIFNDKVADFVAGKKDVNTALREADEEINKKMPQLKQK